MEATAEQVEQHGLRLVVGGMTRGCAGRQRPEPGVSRPRLQVRSRNDPHPVHDHFDTQAGRMDHGLDVQFGPVAQAVIDVVSDRRAVGGHRQHETGRASPHHPDTRSMATAYAGLGERAPPDQREPPPSRSFSRKRAGSPRLESRTSHA